jgi:hypothetical protein
MHKTTKKEKRNAINKMLTAIDKDSATGLYDILRVVGAFPLTADFDSKSKEVGEALGEDRHALAQLSTTALTTALATTPHGPDIQSMLTTTLKRTRGEVDDQAEAGQPRRKSRRKERKQSA